jgi:hypothetical protein
VESRERDGEVARDEIEEKDEVEEMRLKTR